MYDSMIGRRISKSLAATLGICILTSLVAGAVSLLLPFDPINAIATVALMGPLILVFGLLWIFKADNVWKMWGIMLGIGLIAAGILYYGGSL